MCLVPSQTLAMKGPAYMMAELHWTDCRVGHYAAHSQNSPYLAYIKPSYNCLFKGGNIPSRWKSAISLRQALFPTLVTRVVTALVWSHNWKLFSDPKVILSDLCVMERTLTGESGDYSCPHCCAGDIVSEKGVYCQAKSSSSSSSSFLQCPGEESWHWGSVVWPVKHFLRWGSPSIFYVCDRERTWCSKQSQRKSD